MAPRRAQRRDQQTTCAVLILAASFLCMALAQEDTLFDEVNKAGLAERLPVYIVRMRNSPPVAGYTGGIDGLAATVNGQRIAQSFRAGAAATLAGRRRFRFDPFSRPVQQFARWLGQMQARVAADAGVSTRDVLYSYKYVSNGFAARLTAKQVRQLRNHPAVAQVKQSIAIRKLTTDTPTFLQLPNTLWAAAGGQSSAGQGVVVGVIDTGVWPEHPSFAGDASYPNPPATWKGNCTTTADFPSCTRKLIGARFFSAGFRAAYGSVNLAADWNSARDADGHGTWCAGAATGNSNVQVAIARGLSPGLASEVAPRAFLSVYKVFWSTTSGGVSATWADIEAAVNKAVATKTCRKRPRAIPYALPHSSPLIPPLLSLSLRAATGNSNVQVAIARGQSAGLASGVAPRAFLSVYKVFWSTSSGGVSATWADIEAAVNKAVADGVDVLSLSLGGLDPSADYFDDSSYLYANAMGVTIAYVSGNDGSPPYSSTMYRTISNFSPPSFYPFPLFLPTLFIQQMGVTVAYASGNDGSPPYSSTMYRTISNFSPFYLTVGASTISRRYSTSLLLGNGVTVAATGFGSGSASVVGLRVIEGISAMAASATSTQAQYCYSGSLDSAKVSGRIVVCSYGSVGTSVKVGEVLARGGKAVIITGVPTVLKPFPPYDSRLPLVYLDYSPADTLITYIRSTTSVLITKAFPPFSLLSATLLPTLPSLLPFPTAPYSPALNPTPPTHPINSPTATLSTSFSTVTDLPAPNVIYFSSAGPSLNPSAPVVKPQPTNDILKPDIIAPGVSLWSSWRASSPSSTTQQFAMISGTSMATPHVAGIAALLTQRYPTWSPAQIMSAIMTTASTTTNQGSPIGTSYTAVATPFEMGQGHINSTGLLDPGLTYTAALAHYYNFLAGQDQTRMKYLIGAQTKVKLTPIPAYNLNRPAISVSRLVKSVVVTRWVVNVFNQACTYTASVVAPANVRVTVSPSTFTISPAKTQTFTVTFNVTTASQDFSYGSLTWRDQFGHAVRSVLAVQPISL
ncbi:unnamed protein product [Closterium sp. Yama58-4]|nr:unnamed protein product [Closterium sp. Yama58-4]